MLNATIGFIIIVSLMPSMMFGWRPRTKVAAKYGDWMVYASLAGFIASIALEDVVCKSIAEFVTAFGASTLFIMAIMRAVASRYDHLSPNEQYRGGVIVTAITALFAGRVSAWLIGPSGFAAGLAAAVVFVTVVMVTSHLRTSSRAQYFRVTE